MTNEIATLPAEVAAAIEALRNAEYTDYGIVTLSAEPRTSQHGIVLEKWTKIQPGENPQLLLDALVNGYQVEATPEQKVREYYEKAGQQAQCDSCFKSEYRAIRRTLDLLGIQIEGVNA